MSGSGPARGLSLEEIHRLILAAIVAKRPIAVVYHGQRRLLCPHILGWNKEEQLRVLCYQFGGASNSGLEPLGSPANWRCIVLEKVQSVELLEGRWHTAPTHKRRQTCVERVEIDVEFVDRGGDDGILGKSSPSDSGA